MCEFDRSRARSRDFAGPLAVVSVFALLAGGCGEVTRRAFSAAELGACVGLRVSAAAGRLHLADCHHYLTQELTDASVDICYVLGSDNDLTMFVDGQDPSLPSPGQYDADLSYEDCLSARVAGLYSKNGESVQFAGDLPFRLRLSLQSRGLLPRDQRTRVLVLPTESE